MGWVIPGMDYYRTFSDGEADATGKQGQANLLRASMKDTNG